VLLCYWPALSGGILWDDPAHIPRAELQGWNGLQRIWTDLRATQQYYPVLFSTFWLEHHVWGNHTLGYHLVNVVFHATSCCVLALLLRRLWALPTAGPSKDQRATTVPAGAEWVAAFLFSVHPVCVESVAWITEQKNTLSLLFYLLAAYFYVEFMDTRRRGSYAAAFILFLLALGSKTITTTLPAALLVVAWWKRGRLSWREDVVPLLPWFLSSIGVGLLTSWVERKIIGAEGATFELSLVERLLLAGRAIWFYLGKLVWPADLMFFYPRWEVSGTGYAWIGYAVAALILTAVLWFWRGRNRAPLTAWLLFVGGLTPILGFFNVFFFKFSYVNDHFQYLACLAPLAIAAAGLALVLEKMPLWARQLGRIGCIAIIAVLVLLSRRQSALYRNNETLFRAAVAQNPETWMGHYILGFTLAKSPAGHDEAVIHFRESLRLNPRYPDGHLALAVELSKAPEPPPEAMTHYEQAIALRPGYAEAHNDFGVELAKIPGRQDEAISHYREALRLKPDFAEAHFNLARSLAGDPAHLADALAHFEEAVRLNPDFSQAHFVFALQLSRIPGRENEAIAHFEEALRSRPDFLDARNALAILYIQLGQPARARAQWEAALQTNPNYETARRNLRLLDELSAH
jgi:tetratricopeptide (TPR) repeat protein